MRPYLTPEEWKRDQAWWARRRAREKAAAVWYWLMFACVSALYTGFAASNAWPWTVERKWHFGWAYFWGVMTIVSVKFRHDDRRDRDEARRDYFSLMGEDVGPRIAPPVLAALIGAGAILGAAMLNHMWQPK